MASVSVSQNTTPPVATISGNLTVTSGGSTILTASGGTSQRWSTGETTASIAVTAGTYPVAVTNASGCSSATSVTVSTVNSAPVATVNAGPDGDSRGRFLLHGQCFHRCRDAQRSDLLGQH